jgi:2,3,4,5-tetrahydropyridine-2,6-dicarboxylate N-succinyltransferase
LNSHEELQAAIDNAYEARAQLTPRTTPGKLRTAVENAIELLNDGALRVAQPEGGRWHVNE